MELKKLEDLMSIAKAGGKRRLVVAASADLHVLEAVRDALKNEIIDVILVGDENKTKEICKTVGLDLSRIEIINEPQDADACKVAVKCIRENKADVLMKGIVPTAILLKAVLDKEEGLRTGACLSHLALIESPYYHKLLAISDAGVNVAPELGEKISIINNSVAALRGIGIDKPKVAILGPVELVNPKIQSTIDASLLVQMNRRGQIKNCIVDGPLAFDNAISTEACEIKKIETQVGGDADIVVAPELNAANILYKSLSFMGGAKTAAVIMGAKCPIVLTSRADSEHSKLYSIVLATAMLK